MNEFRQLSDQNGCPLIRNSHKLYKISNRKIYHVNGSDYITEILYPFPKTSHKKTEKLRIRFRFKSSNKVKKPIDNNQSKKKDKMNKNEYCQKSEFNTSNKKNTTDRSSIINFNEKEYFEPVLVRRNIIESVVQWLRNSVAQNRRETSSLHETTEMENEEFSLEKRSATTTQATTTMISTSVTEVKCNARDEIKLIKTFADDYSLEITPSLKSVELNPWNTNCKYNKSTKKNKIHRRNKVKLFSDFESNFTQQVVNGGRLESDGAHATNTHESVSLYKKPKGTLKKKTEDIISKQYVNLKCNEKETDKQQRIKLREGNSLPRSSEHITKSLLSGFKNIYLKYKHDFDNRNCSNVINKSEFKNDSKKEDKGRDTKTKDSSKHFFNQIKNNYYQSLIGEKNYFKREKSLIKNNRFSDSEYSTSFVSFKNNCDKCCKHMNSKKSYFTEQEDKTRKLKYCYKNISKNLDILTPLKIDLDFLPKNFKDINYLNRRKHQMREKSCQKLIEAQIIHDSITRKHKRTQTLAKSKSSSSEQKNIIYISSLPEKKTMFRRASDTSREKKVKFNDIIKKYSNHKSKRGYRKNRRRRNDLKFSQNKEKHTFGNVKVKKTSSHESMYIFMKESIDNENAESKKKPGILHEWLSSAKDLITGPRS